MFSNIANWRFVYNSILENIEVHFFGLMLFFRYQSYLDKKNISTNLPALSTSMYKNKREILWIRKIAGLRQLHSFC